MSFKRQNLNEEYSTTADWLKDFARELQKKSYNIQNLTNIRQMTDGPKKFGSIEEKMADIKDRIGFDIIKTMHDSADINEKTASCECSPQKNFACGCKVKTASHNEEHSEQDLKSMSNIISYIKDVCKDEGEPLSPIMVISRCREEPGLRFNDLPINMGYLTEWISKELDKHADEEIEVKHISRDGEMEGIDEKPAEYWSHAFPDK